MDSYNYNATRKRKLSKSKEQEEEEELKRKSNKSIGCFGRCCMRKKQDIISIEKPTVVKTSINKIPLKNENINQHLQRNSLEQTISNEKVLDVPTKHLTRSPLYNETTFCQKDFDFYHDPCIERVVQYGPDTWENIPKLFQNSNKQLFDNNKSMSIEKLDTILHKKTSDTNLEKLSTNEKLDPFKNNINSFINDVIGDGVDRISEMLTTYPNKLQEFQIDDELFINSQENDLNRKQKLDFINQQQHQYPGLVFKKQNLKKSSPTLPDDHTSNQVNFDQEKRFNKENSSQNQEPYNWDDQEYLWPSSFDPSENSHLINSKPHKSIVNSTSNLINDENTLLSDDDTTDPTYSIASVLPSNRKAQSYFNDLTKPSLHTTSNHQQKSVSNLSEEKTFLPSRNSLTIIENNNDHIKHLTSSELLHYQELLEQNDRLSSTSVSELFKQITQTKKQKSLDLDSISTAYSIPVSIRPSVLPEDITNKNPVQTSRTTFTDKHFPVATNKETKQLKSSISINADNQIKSTNTNVPLKQTSSHSTDKKKKRLSDTAINDTVNQIHSTYDDILKSWRYYLERLSSFILPSIHNVTDHNINLSSSIITSNTHSWSTLTSAQTRHMIHSDNIGPWWGRRDVDDQTPATFIFLNEPLRAWYAIEMISSNKQMCTSIKNRSGYSTYSSCPNTCYCCVCSSININNSSSSS